MKKFSILAAFLLTVLISASVSAANWVTFYSEKNTDYLIDRNSIRRGVQSAVYKINDSNGYSAHVKLLYKNGDSEMYLIAFWDDGNKKRFAWLEKLDANGKPLPDHSMTYNTWSFSEKDGWVWHAYVYIKKALS